MELALKYLDTGAMLAITGHWIGDPTFATIDEVKPLLPAVKKAHKGLLAAKPMAPATTDPAVSDLAEKERAKDVQHDHDLRALYFLLAAAEESARAQHPADGEAAERYADASRRLFPEGLAGTQAMYLTEAGNADQAHSVLKADPELKKTLGELRLTMTTTALDLFAAYVKHGRELGELERMKSNAGASAVVAPGTLLKARNAWIEIVKTVVQVLGHAEGDVVVAMLRSVQEPAQKAAKLAAAAAKSSKKTKNAPEAGATASSKETTPSKESVSAADPQTGVGGTSAATTPSGTTAG